MYLMFALLIKSIALIAVGKLFGNSDKKYGKLDIALIFTDFATNLIFTNLSYGRFIILIVDVAVIFSLVNKDALSTFTNKVRSFGITVAIYSVFIVGGFLFYRMLGSYIYSQVSASLLIFAFYLIMVSYEDFVDYEYGIELLFLPIFTILVLFWLKNSSVFTMLFYIFMGIYINLFFFKFYEKTLMASKLKTEQTILIEENKVFAHQFQLAQEAKQSLQFLRHDLKNHCFAIDSLLEEGKIVEAKKYIQTMTKTLEDTKMYSNTGNYLIDSLLNYKLSKANKENINVYTDILIPPVINVLDFDIVTILGNLLDNALEASSQCEKRHISLKLECKFGFFTVCISNSYDSKVYKSKDGRGLGLQSVNRVLKKYNGAMEVKQTKEYYEVICCLYEL